VSHHPLLNTHILEFLPDDLDNLIVLDMGCGLGEWGFIMRTRKRGSPYLIGIDVWHPYLERVCPLEIYDELIQVRLPHIPLKEKSIDISIACEVLEHLSKIDGYELMTELEGVTEKIIIVSTPLNWQQEEICGNPFEKHINEWLPKDFIRRGYETKVVHVLPKTLEVANRIRSIIFRLPPTPQLIVARKRLK